MGPAEYIEALEVEGSRLADTASELDVASPVPTCPGWVLRDLLRHLGGVHRWAGAHLRDRRDSILRVDDFEASYQRMLAAGVRFVSSPRHEPYGQVAVFLDLEGNRWDLLGPDPR